MLVKVNKAGIINVIDIILKPGVNQLDEKQAAKFKEHIKNKNNKPLQALLENDTIEIIEDAGIKEDAEGAIDISKMSEKAAIKLIKETVQTDLLDKFAASEERKKVLDAIAKQQAALVVKPEDFRKEKE